MLEKALGLHTGVASVAYGFQLQGHGLVVSLRDFELFAELKLWRCRGLNIRRVQKIIANTFIYNRARVMVYDNMVSI
jgi:hypothetical protein